MKTSLTPYPKSESASQRRTTIADVARVAGVSSSAVSHVLSERAEARIPEATRRRILAAAEQVGYRRNALAAALRGGRMNSVGILFPGAVTTAEPLGTGGIFHKDILLALATAAFAAGLNPLLLSDDTSRAITLADLTDRRVDGIIVAVHEDAEGFVREAESARIPCVTIERACGQWQVHADNARGARLAVEHLVSLGHRRIAYLWYAREEIPSAQDRRVGFWEGVRAAGIPKSDVREFVYGAPEPLLEALRASEGPTAFFCYNDELAFWLLDQCRVAEVQVPNAVSIVGFDDNVIAALARPRLTTVRNPLKEMAEAAIDLLIAQLSGGVPPAPVIISPTLAVHDSTAAPKREEPVAF